MSADEQVALYDPADLVGRVVGSAPRARVRAENLPHAATGVIVRRADGAVFVHRRADSKDLWPALHDCASGGIVLAGETPEQAARRELLEELGIEPDALRPLLVSWYRGADAHYLGHVYETDWDGDVRFTDGEVAHGWWERQESLARLLADPSWPFVPDTRHFVELLAGAVAPAPVGALPGAEELSLRRPLPEGATVVYRWGRGGRTSFARLGRVVRHDDDGLLLWVAPGSATVLTVLADGRALRADPLPKRAIAPRRRVMSSWWGTGILMLVPTGGEPWSVWWFYDEDGTFRNWYGNLESPHVLRCTARGSLLLDTSDRALDVVVDPDGTPHWKDEDEFAAYTGQPGRWTEQQVPQVRADGEHLFALARSAAAPFDGRWTTFTPDPSWPTPTFPDDWDVPHLAAP